MESFEATPKQWGNSLGITIPKDIIKKEGLAANKSVKILVVGSAMNDIKKAYGTLKLKKLTQKAMDEIDEGYD